MSNVKFAKVRRTSYATGKPAGATANPPNAALEFLATRQAEDQRMHDLWVRGLSTQTLFAIRDDLAGRPAWDLKNNEHRWVMHRRAAVLRALSKQLPQ